MKKILLSLLITVLALSSPVYSKDFLQFKIPDQNWHKAFGKTTPDIYMYTFVPNGQTVQRWDESFTIQSFISARDKLNSSSFGTNYMEILKKDNPSLNYNIIENSDNNFIAESWLGQDKATASQYELIRVIKGTEAIHLLFYISKKPQDYAVDREKWFNFIKSIRYSTQAPIARGELKKI